MRSVELIKERLEESSNVKLKISMDDNLISQLDKLAIDIASTIKNGSKLLLCGNGGSASDALHFAGEIVGRFQAERKAWPAVALNADVATMTAIANDYGYDQIFARQVEGIIKKDDMLIGISTSGNSKNIIEAVKVAKKYDGKTVCLLGKDGGDLKKISDISIVIPSDTTARIQECHITIIHILCELIEVALKNK